MSEITITEVETPAMTKEVYIGFYRFKGQKDWQTTTKTFDNPKDCMEALDDIWSEYIDIKTAKVVLPV